MEEDLRQGIDIKIRSEIRAIVFAGMISAIGWVTIAWTI
jgi:hypothetical protein